MFNPVETDHNHGGPMKHDSILTITKTTILVLGLVTALIAMPAVGSACDNEIRIAPETLNLKSSGTVVTVHTDVYYWTVDVYTVYLGGEPISAWKADDRGYFVAKFLMDDIKAIDGLVIDDYNTLQFVAVTLDGEPICGEADVMVIDRGTRAKGSGDGQATR